MWEIDNLCFSSVESAADKLMEIQLSAIMRGWLGSEAMAEGPQGRFRVEDGAPSCSYFGTRLVWSDPGSDSWRLLCAEYVLTRGLQELPYLYAANWMYRFSCVLLSLCGCYSLEWVTMYLLTSSASHVQQPTLNSTRSTVSGPSCDLG